MTHRLLATTLLLISALSPGARTTEGADNVVRSSSTVRDQYFDVAGANADAVFASIARKRLGDEPGRGASGLTESDFRYSLEMLAPDTDACRITTLDLDLEIVVTLPRHRATHSLDADDRRNWEIYATAVELHEYRHVEIALRGLEEVSARIERGLASGRIRGRGKTACKNYVDRLLAEQRETTKRRHADFHREDARVVRALRRGAREEIGKLDAELEQLTASIDALDKAISATETERRRIEAWLRRLREDYGTTLPEAQFIQAEKLQRNARELLDEMNSGIEARNGLLPEHRTLVATRNRRARDLAWIR